MEFRLQELISNIGVLIFLKCSWAEDVRKISSILEILNGPGNSDKINIDTIPGSRFIYSGGDYTIL